MGKFVLDSFALLAYFQDEPGKRRVDELLLSALSGVDEVCMAVVNLGETLCNLRRRYGDARVSAALARIEQLPIEVVDVGLELTRDAALLKSARRLGFLDCFAAALAYQRQAAVVTGDPGFAAVEDLVPIEWLPHPTR
jgi:predicted nucleic acid-binding protein